MAKERNRNLHGALSGASLNQGTSDTNVELGISTVPNGNAGHFRREDFYCYSS